MPDRRDIRHTAQTRALWSALAVARRSARGQKARAQQGIAEGRELGDVTTLRDPDVMQQLESRIKEIDSEN